MDRRQTQGRVYEVAQTLIAKLSAPSILQALVDAIAAEVVGVDLVGYFERQSDATFVGKYANKVPLVPVPGQIEHVPLSVTALSIDLETDAFAREVVETGGSVYIPDARHDPRPDPLKVAALEMHSLLGLPVCHGGHLFGLVFLHDQGKAMQLSSETRQAVEAFVAMAGIALNNAQLLDDTHRLARMTRELAMSQSTEQILDTCFRHLTDVSGLPECGIYRLEDDPTGQVLVPSYLKPSDTISSEEWKAQHGPHRIIRVAEDRLFQQLLRDQSPICIDDVASDPRPDAEICRRLDIRSLLLIPLVASGTCQGALVIPSLGKSVRFSPRVQTLCQAIAETTAIALNHAAITENLGAMVAVRTLELSASNARLEKAVCELRSLDRLKSEFVSMVSHELRTPLTSIMGYAEFLEDGISGSLSNDQQRYVYELQTSARRLGVLIDDLLDFSRFEAGTLGLQRRSVDLLPLIREAVDSLHPVLVSEHQQLQLEVQGEPALVWADPHRITQVLSNLIGNAIKFNRPDGRITVACERSPLEIVVSVADSGLGIAPEHLPHLFEKFYQVDPSLTRTQGGAGLGLFIAKSLIESHEGSIGVQSEVGVGSTFWFRLPCLDPSEHPLGER